MIIPFEKVYIGQNGQISWSQELDICGDSMYLEITGKKPEDVFPALRQASMDARGLRNRPSE